MFTDIKLAAIVTVLAVLFYFYTLVMVGRKRHRYGVMAPATTGHPDFERAYRVQMNTLEAMPMFLPLLWLGTLLYDGRIAAGLGLVWLVGRVVYLVCYLRNANRAPGFGLQMLAIIGLLGITVLGIIR